MMFGPHDKDSANSGELTKWGIKRKSNDELRQRFVNMTVAQAKAINLTLPDPELKYDEASGNWHFVERSGPVCELAQHEYWRHAGL